MTSENSQIEAVRVRLLGYTGKSYQTLGDRSCVFNALSEHLQCTVNPLGDCKTCPDYQKRED